MVDAILVLRNREGKIALLPVKNDSYILTPDNSEIVGQILKEDINNMQPGVYLKVSPVNITDKS